jgi:hypothetical protein
MQRRPEGGYLDAQSSVGKREFHVTPKPASTGSRIRTVSAAWAGKRAWSAQHRAF